MVKPYEQHTDEDGSVLRTFSINTDSDELVWHRDREDRDVTVVAGSGWSLQLDNMLPVEMIENETYRIPKETYHRIIKGNTDLMVKIAFLPNEQ